MAANEEDMSLGLAYRFRGLVHHHHSGKYGSTQAEMVLEAELKVLHLIIRERESFWVWLEFLKPHSLSQGTYLLQ